MGLACLLTFVVAFLLSLAGVLVMERMAERLGLVDHPGGRKIHTKPTPLGGGIAVWLGTLVPVLGGAVLAWQGGAPWLGERLNAFVHAQAPLVLSRGWLLVALVVGGTATVLLGLLDDRWNLSARTRLLGQAAIALAVFLISKEVRITLFSSQPWVWGVLTVLWIVVITNSFNLLDNMDGLSGGVALIAAGLLVAGALATGQWFVALFLLAFSGALVAFLLRNFGPRKARIFAGSAGGYLFGFLLAVSTVTFTYYDYARGRPLWSALVPVLVLSVAMYDTASVILIRLREGRPILVGDRCHLSHRLVGMGLSRREAVLTIYLLAFAAGCPSLFFLNPPYEALLVFAETFAILGVVALMELAGRGRLRRESGENEGGGAP